jgi:hypothetical protein
VLAVGFEDVAVELQEHEPRHLQLASGAEAEQPLQRTEAVAWRIDGVLRLGGERGVLGCVARRAWEVRKVRDDDVQRLRERLEQVSLDDVHAVAHAVSFRIHTREIDGVGVRVRRPHLDLRCGNRDRDADRPGSRPDVRNSDGPVADARQGRVDECLRCRARREHASGRGQELESVEGRFHTSAGHTRGVTDWIAHAERERKRYRDGEARLPDTADPDARQRQLTRMGNAAAGAALALRMARRDDEAAAWFAHACDRYRESFGDAPPNSWGRPIAILKARVLAGDWTNAERDASWTLELGAEDAASPIGRYAGALALLVLGEDARARVLADALRTHDDFPRPVADALAFLAAHDVLGYVEAIGEVLRSFEGRDAFLEDVPVADTVLVLQAFAAKRDLAAELESDLLPPP